MPASSTAVVRAPSAVAPTADQPNLPPGAPKVKLTAEIGAVRQQSWHLRHPLTVLGSSRTAHIHLADGEVSKVHCALVNTGTHVLLRDLGSLSGTRLNDEPVELARLRDGDLVTLGDVSILVAIQEDPHSTTKRKARNDCPDPIQMPIQWMLREACGEVCWPITRAVATVGRGEGSDVFLDHPDLSLTQAILSHLAGQPVVYNLGARTGMSLNGSNETVGVLSAGDGLKWGQVEMTVDMAASNTTNEREPETPETSAFVPEAVTETPTPSGRPKPQAESLGVDAWVGTDDAETQEMLRTLESRIGALQANIANTWEQLNEWQEALDARDQAVQAQEASVSTRGETIAEQEAALVARTETLDATARELEEREKAVTSEQDGIEAKRQAVTESSRQLEVRESHVSEAEAELVARREALDQQRGELDAQTATLEATRKELENQQAQVASERDAVEQLRAELERRENELAAEKEAAAGQLAEIEAGKQDLVSQAEEQQAQTEALEQRAAALASQEEGLRKQADGLAEREAQLSSHEEALAPRVAEIEQREKALAADAEALEAQTAELEQRETALASRLEAASVREAELAEREAEIETRREAVERDEQEIAARRAKIEAERADLQERSEGLSKQQNALEAREQAVAGQKKAQQMFRGLIENAVESFEKPMSIPKIGPSGKKSAAPEEDGNEGTTDRKTVGAKPDASSDLDIDEDAREQIRMLRRMGNADKSDAELFEQILQRRAAEKNDPTKKGWWSRLK